VFQRVTSDRLFIMHFVIITTIVFSWNLVRF